MAEVEEYGEEFEDHPEKTHTKKLEEYGDEFEEHPEDTHAENHEDYGEEFEDHPENIQTKNLEEYGDEFEDHPEDKHAENHEDYGEEFEDHPDKIQTEKHVAFIEPTPNNLLTNIQCPNTDSPSTLETKTSQSQVNLNQSGIQKHAIIAAVSPVKEKKPLPYEKPQTKPIYSGNGIKITPATAKLFGLKLNNDGKIKLPQEKEEIKVKSEIQRVKELVNKKTESKETKRKKSDDPDKKECTFKPKRSAEAEKAMSNPRCGYDFASKLGDRGEFLERAFKKSETSKTDKVKLEQEKEDYEAKHDKLQCPMCHKEQSFDEYKKRSRSCGQCKERFILLKVANRNLFEKHLKERQEKKQLKVNQLTEKLYDYSYKPVVMSSEIKINKPELQANIINKTLGSRKDSDEAAKAERKRKQEEEKKKKEQIELRAKVRHEALTKRVPIVDKKSSPEDDFDDLLHTMERPTSPPAPRQPHLITGSPKRPVSKKKGSKKKIVSDSDDILEGFKKLINY